MSHILCLSGDVKNGFLDEVDGVRLVSPKRLEEIGSPGSASGSWP
jgi:hypothetical protein